MIRAFGILTLATTFLNTAALCQTWKTESLNNAVPSFDEYEHYYWGDIGGESIYLFYDIDERQKIDGILYYEKDLLEIPVTGPLKVSGLEFELDDGAKMILESDIELIYSYHGHWYNQDQSDSLKCNLYGLFEASVWATRWLHAVQPIFEKSTQNKENRDTLDFELAYRFINMLHDDYTNGAYGDPDMDRSTALNWPEGDYIIPVDLKVEDEFVMFVFDCNLTASGQTWFKERAITGEHIFTFKHNGEFINYIQFTGTYDPRENGVIEKISTNSRRIYESNRALYEFRRIEHFIDNDGSKSGGFAPVYYIQKDGTIYTIPK